MTRSLFLKPPDAQSNVAAAVFLIAALEILAGCAAIAIFSGIISNLP
ncbi:MAG: hypothetical protein WA823_04900 [Candidatus Acidiferrales bacterium]